MKQHDTLKTVSEFSVYGRKLPHWELPGSAYAVTYTVAPGFTISDVAKTIVFESVKFHASKKYTLYACVVMDTHCHVVLQPLEQSKGSFYSLAQIAHSIKSYAANKIQRHLDGEGSIWQNQNYDRVVRDEKALIQELAYVANNPVKAGLVNEPQDYRWLYVVGL